MSDFPEEGDDFDVADDNPDFDNGGALEADNLGDDETELADDDQAEEEGNEPEPDAEVDSDGEVIETVRKQAEPGRNDLCHCGSGKKYKKCHGAT